MSRASGASELLSARRYPSMLTSPDAAWACSVASAAARSGPRSDWQMDQARAVARELVMTGRPVSRRVLRTAGVKGSNEALNGLARTINAEGGPGDG